MWMDGWGILCVWEEDMGMTGWKCFPRRPRQADTAIRGLWCLDEDGWDGLGGCDSDKVCVVCVCCVYVCVFAGAGSELS